MAQIQEQVAANGIVLKPIALAWRYLHDESEHPLDPIRFLQ